MCDSINGCDHFMRASKLAASLLEDWTHCQSWMFGQNSERTAQMTDPNAAIMFKIRMGWKKLSEYTIAIQLHFCGHLYQMCTKIYFTRKVWGCELWYT